MTTEAKVNVVEIPQVARTDLLNGERHGLSFISGVVRYLSISCCFVLPLYITYYP